MAKGQPVETDPCLRLSCSSVGHYVPKALQSGWQDPCGSGTVAWSCGFSLVLDHSELSRCHHLLPRSRQRVDPASAWIQGPEEALVPEVSEGCSIPASASSPLSRAPTSGLWGPQDFPGTAPIPVFPGRNADCLLSTLPFLSGIRPHQSEIPYVQLSARLW